MKHRLRILTVGIHFACVSFAVGQADSEPEHSFLIEEGYNQEVGVVQHILNVVYTNDKQASPHYFWRPKQSAQK